MSSKLTQPTPTKEERSVLVYPEVIKWLNTQKHSSQEDINFVKDFITSRHRFGKEKYGTGLMSFNGRDCVLDVKEELGDCLQYLHQLKLENKTVTPEIKILLNQIVTFVDNF